MKRNMFWGLTAVVLALVMNVPFANAQSAKANIPFDFSVSGTAMPAGIYTVSEIGDGEARVASVQSSTTILVHVQREERLDHQSPRMVFHKYGDKYFLAEVWSGAGNSGLEFPASKWENEMRTAFKNTGGGTEVVVALR